MRTIHGPLKNAVTERHAVARRRSVEKRADWLFNLCILGALCWYVFGGLTLFQHSANIAKFYDGPVYIGLGAVTYSVGWWVRFFMTGWRGLL